MDWRWRMGGIVGGYIHVRRRNNRACFLHPSSAGRPCLVVSSAAFRLACAFEPSARFVSSPLVCVCLSLSVFLSLPLSPAPSPLLPLLVPFFTSSLFSFSLLLLLSPPSLPVEPPIMPFIAHSADCTLHDAWLVRHTSTATKSTSTSTSTRARESITSA
ncbi:hypothetical protein HDV57DRAFT_300340 [Trichoderma longibrachiatum]